MLRKLVGYAAYMFGASSVASLLTLGVTMLGMSTRPKEAFGDYALYILIYTSGQALFVLGANAAVQKFAGGDRENRLRFAKLAYLGFLILLAASLLIAAGVWVATERSVVVFACLGVPWVVVFFWSRYIVRSTLEAKIEAPIMVIGSLSNSIGQFCFLTFTDWRDALIYGDVLALVISGAVAMTLIPSGVQASLRTILSTPIPKDFWKQAIGFAIPLWWAGQVFQARGVLDRSVTRLMLGPQPLGAYQALITMWQFVAKPMDFFGQAVLPGLASVKDDNERELLYRETARVAFLSFCFIGIAAAGGITFLFQSIDYLFGVLGRESPPIGVKYPEVPLLLLVAVLTVPASAAEMVTNQYAVVMGRQNLVFRAQVVTVVVLALAIYPLTERFGILGVVVAGNVAMLANAASFLAGLWSERNASMRTTLRWMILSFALTAISLAPIYWTRQMRFAWVGALPGVVVFVLGAMLFRMLTLSDLTRLKRAIEQRFGKKERDPAA